MTMKQERFRSITKSYYRNSVGAVLCYDITNRSSFSKIPTWMAEAKKHIEPVNPVFLLVGCKGDLANQRQVSTEEGAEAAAALGIHFLETSAKTGKNVEEAFTAVTQEIYDKVKAGEYRGVAEGAGGNNWEGVKRGYAGGGQISHIVLAEGTPEKSKCC